MRSEIVGNCRLPEGISPGDVVGLAIDLEMGRDEGAALVWTIAGTLVMLDLQTGEVQAREPLCASVATGSSSPAARAESTASTLRRVESLGSNRYSLVWSDGSATLLEIIAAKRAPNAGRRRATVRALANLPDKSGDVSFSTARLDLLRRSEAGTVTRVAILPDERICVQRQAVSENPLGEQEVTNHQSVWRETAIKGIRVMTMDRDGTTLYAGTDDGRLVRWRLSETDEAAHREVIRAFPDQRAITALAMVVGDVSLVVGDSRGEVTTWFPVRTDSGRVLRPIHRLQSHPAAIRQIVPSARGKSILSLDDAGTVDFDHMTSERRLLSITAGERPIRGVALGPRGDALLTLDSSGTLTARRLAGGCPEISFKTLFGRVHYEGYDAPDYVWQTTGGEDFEPKFSLVPLLFGTFKGTFYAMLFAVPLALFGAAYCSYFAAPAFRRMIKPVVEVMATVPSVVIGFLIALWLAPIVANSLLAFFVSLLTIPAVFVAFLLLWQLLRRWRSMRRIENGYEFLVLFPVLLIGIGLAVWLAGPIESRFFAGNFRQWLFAGPLAMRYDPRNSIIIAFGLGFTVIPIIFSLADDSLSNVPYQMTAASLALGASRWQTLWRVVLPSASPGVFAALMIGFGRAVGETMIVLMATGNTPILEFSPLNGMRTLSANIAVEIPEAPVGGTLYRVLFLCAVLLFLLTFTVNTAAELVRQRLRKRYGRL
jgi:phosphate transport system permease protein